jgi:hypothetical protein
MTDDATSPTEPKARWPVSSESVAGRQSLVLGMAVALPLTAAVLAGVLVVVNRSDWWRALLPATVIGLFAAAVSLMPLMWGMARGPMKAVGGFFVAGAVRALVALGGGLLATNVGDYPQAPTFLLIVAYYFVALAVEATVLGRSMWTMKF